MAKHALLHGQAVFFVSLQPAGHLAGVEIIGAVIDEHPRPADLPLELEALGLGNGRKRHGFQELDVLLGERPGLCRALAEGLPIGISLPRRKACFAGINIIPAAEEDHAVDGADFHLKEAERWPHMPGGGRAAEALIGVHPKRHLARMEGILALFDIHLAFSP